MLLKWAQAYDGSVTPNKRYNVTVWMGVSSPRQDSTNCSNWLMSIGTINNVEGWFLPRCTRLYGSHSYSKDEWCTRPYGSHSYCKDIAHHRSRATIAIIGHIGKTITTWVGFFCFIFHPLSSILNASKWVSMLHRDILVLSQHRGKSWISSTLFLAY